jgi:hypothetical protein
VARRTATDLAQWLRQQLDTDEQAADMVDGLKLDLAEPPSANGQAMVFLSPERYVKAVGVLSGDRIRAEVNAKRRMLDRHADCGTGHGYCDGGGHSWEPDDGIPVCPDLLDLAATFDYRPGYRVEWRP